MTVPRAQALIEDYRFNGWLISQLIEGLTHQESLIQPDFEANPLNWVLGHILWRRSIVLQVLDRQPLRPEELSAVYASGAPRLTSGDEVRGLDQLRQDLDQVSQEIRSALEEATEEFLDQVVATDRGEKTRFDHLAGFHWHETFHIGQLDMLRSLALSRRED